MAKPCSEDLRERVVRAHLSGRPVREVANLFHVSASSVCKWTKRYRETGSFASGAMGRLPSILVPHEELIVRLAAKTPDMTVTELRVALHDEGVKVSRSRLWSFLGHLGVKLENDVRPAVKRSSPSVEGPVCGSPGARHDLTDEQWEILCPFLPSGSRGPARPNDRRVMNGVLFVARSGCAWRDLPERYGPYTTVYNRFNRWSKDGSWEKIKSAIQELAGLHVKQGDVKNGTLMGIMASFEELADLLVKQGSDEQGAADSLKALMMDSSVVRVHKQGCGSLRDKEPREIGRSRGGLTTKIHAAVDDAGLLLAMHLTAGQKSDCKNAPHLLADLEEGTKVIADKAYDTNAILKQVSKAGGTAVIPSKKNRKKQRKLDKDVYARRNVVERFFVWIKEFRRVATRYDKRARNYMSNLWLSVSYYLLRDLSRQKTGYTA